MKKVHANPVKSRGLLPEDGRSVNLYVIAYGHAGGRWTTVMDGYSRESGETEFKRLNPHVEFISCYDPDNPPSSGPLTSDL